MKTQLITITLTIITIFGSNAQVNIKESEKSNDITEEIRRLETDSAKIIYLEKIFKDDQFVRNGQISAVLMLKYGRDSKEYMEYVNTQLEQDEINLKKVEKYLEIHGYPKKRNGRICDNNTLYGNSSCTKL